MPERCKKPEVQSKYEGEKDFKKEYAKLGKKITDVVPHKLFGVKNTDPEYWGLREVLSEEQVKFLLKLKQRKWYSLEQLIKMNKELTPVDVQRLLDELSYIGFIEYDYGDNYADEHPIEDAPKIKRYRLSYFVPGSAELMNSSLDRIAKNPAVANFFERMTFIPLHQQRSPARGVPS